MKINYYPIMRSAASYVLPKKILKRPGSGGTFSSKYCYSVWLRHLSFLIKNGLIEDISQIENIAEIGPGDSLGIGISALYTGAKRYFAFDVIQHSNTEKNIKINDDLKNYYIQKMEIPHGKGYENVEPKLEDYSFPKEILKFDNEYYINRHKEINLALISKDHSEIQIEYIVPWYSIEKSDINNLDLIFSQAVMEHVDDIDFAYQKMYKWLKKGGVMSHQIDFKAHEMSENWDGHWYINEKLWKFLLRGRKYSINRLPLSAHIFALEKVGFSIKNIVPVSRTSNYVGKQPKITNITFTEKDLTISGALIQVIKE